MNAERLWERLKEKFASRFAGCQPSESCGLTLCSILVGLSAAAGVWLFKQLIKSVHLVAHGAFALDFHAPGQWMALFAPVAGGLAVGLASYYLLPRERLHGVAGIIHSVAAFGGRLSYRDTPVKAAAAAISIGTGASVGPEDPSVQIGANLGALFSNLFRLPDGSRTTLVAAGAAAGIAATFNAPVTGMFFALEIVFGNLSGNAFSFIALSSVAATAFTQAVSGPQPAFQVAAYSFASAWELPLYLGLGLAAGPVAALYIRLLYAAHDLFDAFPVPHWVKPAAAGLAVGVVGVCLPQGLGVGYSVIENTLSGEMPAFTVIIALLFAKLLLTPICIGGGFFGGVFAPALFLGAMLGAAYGVLAQWFFPSLHVVPPAFAMVGMAAVLAGAVHAPITAIMLLFEMTDDYRIVIPLVLAVAVSLIVSRTLQKESVYGFGLSREGIHLNRAAEGASQQDLLH